MCHYDISICVCLWALLMFSSTSSLVPISPLDPSLHPDSFTSLYAHSYLTPPLYLLSVVSTHCPVSSLHTDRLHSPHFSPSSASISRICFKIEGLYMKENMSYLSFSLSIPSLSTMFSNLLKISKIQLRSILSKLNNDRPDLSTEKIKPHKHTRTRWLANILYKVSSCCKLQLSL